MATSQVERNKSCKGRGHCRDAVPLVSALLSLEWWSQCGMAVTLMTVRVVRITWCGAGEMAYCIKMLATKAADLSLVLEMHMVEGQT